ncbi:MAG TPA: class I SAM-dependent methyltransferase [Longimicrobiales bacterium]
MLKTKDQDWVSERAFYDELFDRNPSNEHITSGYEDLYNFAFQQAPGGVVLDLGCGTGAHAVRLAKRGYDVVAVDLSFAGVRAARERFRKDGLKGRFVVADAEHLPFKNKSFAVVWSSLLLHHFPKLASLPDELSRVVSKRVIAMEPNGHNLLSWFAFNIINPIWGLSTTTKNQRALFPKRLDKRMKRSGFRPETFRYVHRAWQDDKRAFGLIRGTYDAIARRLPERFRANKFLVTYQKSA